MFAILEEQRIYVSLSGGDQFMVRSDTVAKVLHSTHTHLLFKGNVTI